VPGLALTACAEAVETGLAPPGAGRQRRAQVQPRTLSVQSLVGLGLNMENNSFR